MENGTKLAITLLNTILDIKEMPKDMKILLRDMAGPAIEYIGNGSTPKDIMTRVQKIRLVMQVPIAIGIHMSIHPKSYTEVALALGTKDFSELTELLKILVQIIDTSKSESVHVGNTEPTSNMK